MRHWFVFPCKSTQTNIDKNPSKLQAGQNIGGCSYLIIATIRILLSGLCHATACFIKSFTPCASFIQLSGASLTVVLETSILLGSMFVGSSAAFTAATIPWTTVAKT